MLVGNLTGGHRWDCTGPDVYRSGLEAANIPQSSRVHSNAKSEAPDREFRRASITGRLWPALVFFDSEISALDDFTRPAQGGTRNWFAESVQRPHDSEFQQGQADSLKRKPGNCASSCSQSCSPGRDKPRSGGSGEACPSALRHLFALRLGTA